MKRNKGGGALERKRGREEPVLEVIDTEGLPKA